MTYTSPTDYNGDKTRGEGEMGYCSNCEHSKSSCSDKICINCGYAFICPRCETHPAHGAKFCPECATSLLPACKSEKKAAVENGPTRITIPMNHKFDSEHPLSSDAMMIPPEELAERGISERM